MRTFDDNHGRHWQAALLEASYGDVMLVFSPMDGTDVRQRLLGADNMAAATDEVAALNDDGLRALLVEAQPWDHQAGVERAQALYAANPSPTKALTSINKRKAR